MIIETKNFHLPEEFSLIAKIIIKTLINENIYTSQHFDFAFKVKRIYYSIDRFYVWLSVYVLLYFEWLDLTHVYLIFCGKEL